MLCHLLLRSALHTSVIIQLNIFCFSIKFFVRFWVNYTLKFSFPIFKGFLFLVVEKFVCATNTNQFFVLNLRLIASRFLYVKETKKVDSSTILKTVKHIVLAPLDTITRRWIMNDFYLFLFIFSITACPSWNASRV